MKKLHYSEDEKIYIVKTMLEAIGENPNRDGLKDTPKRVINMWKEIFRGYNNECLPNVMTFNNGKDGIIYDEMIVDSGDFYSHCEHHMVPFYGRYYFAYIPHPKGKLLGLSKVGRVVDFFSAKLQIQERLVHEIVEYLWAELSKGTFEPIGMALVIDGEHLCKTMRGVKKKGNMRTTKLKGAFKTDINCKTEFLNSINNHKS